MRRAAAVAALTCALCVASPSDAVAHHGCARAVVFTLPGVTWTDVEGVGATNIIAAARDGATGSMSVRTNGPRTTHASGFASIGAGARVDGGRSTGGLARPLPSAEALFTDAHVGGVDEMRTLLDEAGYTTVEPGALARALGSVPVAAIGNSDLGRDPPVPMGLGRWALLSTMNPDGSVVLAATGDQMVVAAADEPFGVAANGSRLLRAVERALVVPCITIVIDPGDLTRADTYEQMTGIEEPRLEALQRADELLGELRGELTHDDLLLVVSPTSPAGDEQVHFGVAVAVGRAFPAGSFLSSPSTRRAGMVTLPDIAPTVLKHHGVARPASMLGRSMFVRAGADPATVVEEQIDLDREAVFIDQVRTPITTVFVVLQVVVYLLVAFLLWRRERKGALMPAGFQRWAALGSLVVVAFPVATYLGGFFEQHALGPLGFVALLLGIDAVIVGVALLASRDPFDRLLVVTGFTCAVLLVDLITGATLQVNTVFSYSPLVAGRFAGLGNLAYSVLAAATVIAAALIVHRAEGSSRALTACASLFTLVVIVDGAPMFGADVGGILALVPGLGITWLLLAGRRPRLTTILWLIVGVVVATALFLALDLAQPEASRTHLARLFENARAGGFDVFVDIVKRKIETNLRVFGSTIWTYLVPPALGLIAWLLIAPSGRWERVAQQYPRLRAGLVASLVVALLGFALNDSGIVVPAMMLSFLAPLALLMHLSLEKETKAIP